MGIEDELRTPSYNPHLATPQCMMMSPIDYETSVVFETERRREDLRDSGETS